MYLLKIETSVLLAIIALGGTFLGFATQIILAIIQSRMREEQKQQNIKVDGRLTQLLEEKEKSSLAIGHAAGMKDQKAETKIEATAPIKLEIPELKVTMVPPTIPPADK